uniref:Retrovirus-related Pol polyprotein from transposon TNT 1-94 n=1 Tax=Cajanus cajan TaxID=3821 RepID=A0A151U318_CAJCA|nr:hypothetical protein KK1_006345 [Cajanus cajan]
MDPIAKLLQSKEDSLKDLGSYQCLKGKVNNLTITKPNIKFVIRVVSGCSHIILRYIKNTPRHSLLYEDKCNAKIISYSDVDWEGSPSNRRFTFGYCVLIGENINSQRSEKQNIVARSSVGVEYRAMAVIACKFTWLKELLQQQKFGGIKDTKLICDNQVTLCCIKSNLS